MNKSQQILDSLGWAWVDPQLEDDAHVEASTGVVKKKTQTTKHRSGKEVSSIPKGSPEKGDHASALSPKRSG